MSRKKIFVFGLVLISLFVFVASPVSAAKKRPSRGWKSSSAPKRSYSRSRGVKTSVKFRSDRRGLLINFGSFGNAVSVTYTLTYTSDGVQQGAMGTATPGTAGQQREVLFGTCSGGVCRYHPNIQNARLIIDSKLNSGITVRKPYRLKV